MKLNAKISEIDLTSPATGTDKIRVNQMLLWTNISIYPYSEAKLKGSFLIRFPVKS
jgi:hypothetical protein